MKAAASQQLRHSEGQPEAGRPPKLEVSKSKKEEMTEQGQVVVKGSLVPIECPKLNSGDKMSMK